MRYEVAIALLSTVILGAGWLWRRRGISPAMASVGPAVARIPVGPARRRPF